MGKSYKIRSDINFIKIMSSKYSEFRKNRPLAQENSRTLRKDSRSQFNLEEIDQMMQALTINIGLGNRQPPAFSRRQEKSHVADSSWKQQSLKNSEMGQTCDLTTNVDSQSISQLQLQKLPLISKYSNRRHHTQQEIEPQGFDAELQTFSRSGFSLESAQCLLDDLQQKEEFSKKSVEEEQKNQILSRLDSLTERLKNKKLSANEANLILQKLSKLQAFISQI